MLQDVVVREVELKVHTSCHPEKLPSQHLLQITFANHDRWQKRTGSAITDLAYHQLILIYWMFGLDKTIWQSIF